MKRLLMLSLIVVCLQFPALAQEAAKPAEPVVAGIDKVKLQGEIEALVKQLGADTWKEREDAMKRLLEIGEPAIPAVAKLRDSEDLEVKTRALKILEKLNYISPEDCAKIDDLIAKYEKVATAKALPEIDGYIKKLESEDEKERADAAKALVETGMPALPPLEKLKASENAALREFAEKISADILKNNEDFETEILDELQKIKYCGKYLLGKLAPGQADEYRQQIFARVISGILKLSYWNGPDNVVVRGNKLVVGGKEMPLPAGPWSIQEKGDKIFINGQEYALPATIERDATPADVLGRIVARAGSNPELKKEALDIIEKRSEKDAARYLVRALGGDGKPDDKEARELKLRILGVLSRIVEDGPACPAADCSFEELQKSIKTWRKWLKTTKK